MIDRNNVSIPDIMAFATVVEVGSFTRAAETLGSSKTSVCRAIRRLEDRLGTHLLQRTIRVITLTREGEIYYDASRAALSERREAEQVLLKRHADASGRVRIDLPAGFGRLLLPALVELRERHPQITLDIALSDKRSDPVADGWVVVVRIGDLEPDSLTTVRKLCDLRFGLFTSPAYLSRTAPIACLPDLGLHRGAVFRGGNGQIRPWVVQDGGKERVFTPAPVLVVADGQSLLDATLRGFGIAQLLDYGAAPHVGSGQLIHVLPSADVAAYLVHALIPVGHRMLSRTRVVLEAIARCFQP
jgi:DNA-binding transcriptional LysR family regulator